MDIYFLDNPDRLRFATLKDDEYFIHCGHRQQIMETGKLIQLTQPLFLKEAHYSRSYTRLAYLCSSCHARSAMGDAIGTPGEGFIFTHAREKA